MFSSEDRELEEERDALKADNRVLGHLVRILGNRNTQLQNYLEGMLEHEPPPEPDYEALGYPETDFSDEVNPDYVAGVVISIHRWIHSLTREEGKISHGNETK